MFNIFSGGMYPDPVKPWGHYPFNNEKLVDLLSENHCPELLTGSGSAVNEHDFLAKFMSLLQPEAIDIIEIGTFLGLGTALMASYSRSVLTFDITYRNSHHIWNLLEVEDRVNCFTGDQKYIDTTIRDIQFNPKFNFNFAFIDGQHKRENVIHDFELVKFCGRVLFHDANIPEIRSFIDKIGAVIVNEDSDEPAKFAYWEDK